MSEENLKIYWEKSTCEFPKIVRDSWWNHILEKYNENGRYCHNYKYLQEKFKEMNDIINYIKDIQAFVIALFLQYLEYSPLHSECQDKILKTLYKFASEVGINNGCDLFKQIKALLEAAAIHSTDEHKTDGAYGNTDVHYFLDLDMTILGTSETAYAQYADNIHREYSELDDEAYKKLRKKVLKSFLLIPNIFATKHFRDKYEIKARKNISRELETLKKS